VPVQTPFVPDRAGRLPLNMVPELIEVASFHLRDQSVGKAFTHLTNSGFLSVAKAQEIKVFPGFYKHWKPNDNLQIHSQLRDVGTKSFNIQFDIYDETCTNILCRSIRSIVVCDVKLKPQPIPEKSLEILKSNAFHEERYFIPQAFKSKSDDAYETSTIVKPSDLDVYYHVNQANYLEFMLNAAVSAARNGAYKSLKQDIAFASVDQITLDYLRELCLDENVKIETWEDNEHPMKICFEMSSGAKIAFQGSVLLHEPLLKLSDEIKQKFPRAAEF
jgi:acyl-CoA thioesterase FadM